MNLTKEMIVKIKKLHPNAVIPSYANPGDAGMDIQAIDVSIQLEQVHYKTGLAIEIPEGYVGLIFPRSSVRNKNLSLSNSVGVIDSGYRGEIVATFNWRGMDKSHYKVGDRIMQLMIIPYPQVEFEETDTLSDTKRSAGGFCSTGT